MHHGIYEIPPLQLFKVYCWNLQTTRGEGKSTILILLGHLCRVCFYLSIPTVRRGAVEGPGSTEPQEMWVGCQEISLTMPGSFETTPGVNSKSVWVKII